jgi:hypothetical protein
MTDRTNSASDRGMAIGAPWLACCQGRNPASCQSVTASASWGVGGRSHQIAGLGSIHPDYQVLRRQIGRRQRHLCGLPLANRPPKRSSAAGERHDGTSDRLIGHGIPQKMRVANLLRDIPGHGSIP